MTKLDQKYVLKPLQQLLSHCHNNVLLGLRLVENIDRFPNPTSDELKLIQIQLMLGNQSPNINHTKKLFKKWLLINGFEDIHSCIRTTLERLFIFKSIENQLKTNPSLEINKANAILKKRVNKYNYPSLINAVHAELNDTLEYEKQLESINNARNCLVHRNGIIQEKDCNNEKKDKLLISGQRFKMFFKKGDDEVIAEIGKPGPENAALMLGAEEFRIEFHLGHQLDISLKQFVDILSTCIFFNADIEEKLKGNAS